MTQRTEQAARKAFLDIYRKDLSVGKLRTLAEYQCQFPGHEQGIAEEWQLCLPRTSSAAPDPHPSGAWIRLTRQPVPTQILCQEVAIC